MDAGQVVDGIPCKGGGRDGVFQSLRRPSEIAFAKSLKGAPVQETCVDPSGVEGGEPPPTAMPVSEDQRATIPCGPDGADLHRADHRHPPHGDRLPVRRGHQTDLAATAEGSVALDPKVDPQKVPPRGALRQR